MEKQEALKRLREFIEEEVGDSDHVYCPDIAKKAIEHFAGDPAVLAALVFPAVYDQTRYVMHQTHRGAVIDLDSGEMAATNKVARSVFADSKYRKWMEHIGDGHKQYLKLTSIDCFAAAKLRRIRERTENIRATMLERLGRELGPGQVVGDLYTPAQLEEMEKAIAEELYGMTERKGA